MEKDPKEKSQPKSRIIFCGLNENLDSKDSPASLLIKSLPSKNSEVLNKMTGKEEEEKNPPSKKLVSSRKSR